MSPEPQASPTTTSPRILVVVATALEAARLPELPHAEVVVSGIGAVNAALATQLTLIQQDIDLVISVGIGGAYPGSGLGTGDVALASECVFAQLGAMDDSEFLGLEQLGFPLVAPAIYNRLPVAPWASALAREHSLAFGPFLTVETVTGRMDVAQSLRQRYVGALVEGMEGAGVALAALRGGRPMLELRGISNPVGPRDRRAWDIPVALEHLQTQLTALWPWVVAQCSSRPD
jgi:futalosine hydrolase